MAIEGPIPPLRGVRGLPVATTAPTPGESATVGRRRPEELVREERDAEGLPAVTGRAAHDRSALDVGRASKNWRNTTKLLAWRVVCAER